MWRIIKVLLINLMVLLVLLVALEVTLRLAGMETIVAENHKTPGRMDRFRHICDKVNKQNLEVYDRFYTDSEGIFKARQTLSKNGKDKISINNDGFRGKPFECIQTSKPKILLIGDSFAWGATAEPLKNSYADLLEEAGYYVYNAGIPGTDPQQYAMIADKYTAKLKPDILAVCVYLGNDISNRPLLIEPNKNAHYVTNFGFLRGYDHHNRFFNDAREAFDYMKKRECGYISGPLDYIIFKTVIGRALENLITGTNRNPRFDGTKKWVSNALHSVQKTCDRHNAKCIFFLIPFVHQDVQRNKSIQKNLYLFEGLSYYYPEHMEKTDYCEPPNNHFNNRGHRKYADFMIKVLKQNGFDTGK